MFSIADFGLHLDDYDWISFKLCMVVYIFKCTIWYTFELSLYLIKVKEHEEKNKMKATKTKQGKTKQERKEKGIKDRTITNIQSKQNETKQGKQTKNKKKVLTDTHSVTNIETVEILFTILTRWCDEAHSGLFVSCCWCLFVCFALFLICITVIEWKHYVINSWKSVFCRGVYESISLCLWSLL